MAKFLAEDDEYDEFVSSAHGDLVPAEMAADDDEGDDLEAMATTAALVADALGLLPLIGSATASVTALPPPLSAIAAGFLPLMVRAEAALAPTRGSRAPRIIARFP